MVKLTLTVFIAALLAAPALASFSDIETRAISDDDLASRELSENEASLFTRDLQELYSRGLPQDDVDELASRSPHWHWHSIGKALKTGASIASNFIKRSDEPELFAREYDELNAREFDDLD